MKDLQTPLNEAELEKLDRFLLEEGWKILDRMSEEEVENLRQAITPNVRDIHAVLVGAQAPTAPGNGHCHT